jgi:hypothetical protein
LTGLSKAQIRENITAAIAKNELPIRGAGAMSYMMSKAGNPFTIGQTVPLRHIMHFSEVPGRQEILITKVFW